MKNPEDGAPWPSGKTYDFVLWLLSKVGIVAAAWLPRRRARKTGGLERLARPVTQL